MKKHTDQEPEPDREPTVIKLGRAAHRPVLERRVAEFEQHSWGYPDHERLLAMTDWMKLRGSVLVCVASRSSFSCIVE
jgi:hypothetical protein